MLPAKRRTYANVEYMQISLSERTPYKDWCTAVARGLEDAAANRRAQAVAIAIECIPGGCLRQIDCNLVDVLNKYRQICRLKQIFNVAKKCFLTGSTTGATRIDDPHCKRQILLEMKNIAGNFTTINSKLSSCVSASFANSKKTGRTTVPPLSEASKCRLKFALRGSFTCFTQLTNANMADDDNARDLRFVSPRQPPRQLTADLDFWRRVCCDCDKTSEKRPLAAKRI